jgi:hypothetical protein
MPRESFRMKRPFPWPLPAQLLQLCLLLILSTVSVSRLVAQELSPTLVTNPPPIGTFYWLSGIPPVPYPFDPARGLLPIWFFNGAYYVDDSELLRELRESGLMALFDELPPPPGGGPSGGGDTNFTCNTLTNFTVDYRSSASGLALAIAPTTNSSMTLTIQTATTNTSYDLFGSRNMGDLVPASGHANWMWLTRTRGSPTNFSWGETNWCERYFQAGALDDYDNDGLTDICERLITGTATNVPNSPQAVYEAVIGRQNPSHWFKLNSTLTNAISGQPALTLNATWDVDTFATGSNAIQFNGINQRLIAGDVISGGTGTNQGSLSLLFRTMSGHANTNVSLPRYLFSQRDNDTNEFALFFETTNTMTDPGSLKLRIGSQTNTILASNAIVFSTWYYLALTWNDSNHLATCYLSPIGGALSSSNFNFGATNAVGNSSNVIFGNRQGVPGNTSASNHFNAFRTPGNGALDQIALWNRELTASEVNEQFNTLNALFIGPAKAFDLSRWNILLPVDKTNSLNPSNLAQEISTGWLNSGFKYVDPADWTQKYFYLSTTNTMVFEAPWNGSRSSGGSGARSELRGTRLDGSEDNWTLAGTNTLEGTCSIISAGTNGTNKVIIGQIYSESAGAPTFAVNYNFPKTNQVSVTYRFNPTNSADDNLILATNVNLRDVIHYKIQVINDGTNVSLRGEASTNGVPYPPTLIPPLTTNPSNVWHSATFYFKAGCYYPNNPASGTAKVIFYDLSATREP